MTNLRKNFLSGIITMLPICVSLIFVVISLDILTSPFTGIIDSIINYLTHRYGINYINNGTLLVLIEKIIVLILLFFITLIAGIFGEKIIFRYFMNITTKILTRTPFVGRLYNILREIISSILIKKDASHPNISCTLFPHDLSKVLSIEMGSIPPSIANILEDNDFKTLFVPTSPHPLSGFVLIVPKAQIKGMGTSIEDALKFLISCGQFHPKNYGQC